MSPRARYRYFAMKLSPHDVRSISDDGITGTWETFDTAKEALRVADDETDYGPAFDDIESTVMRIVGESDDSYRRRRPEGIEVQVGSAWVPFREWAAHSNPPWKPEGVVSGGSYQTFYPDGRKSWAFESKADAKDWAREIGGTVEERAPGGYTHYSRNPADSDDGHMAWVVMDTARRVPSGMEGRYGYKAPIAAVYHELVAMGRDSGLSLAQFKAILVRLHREGLVPLVRTDLRRGADVELLEESTIRDGMAEYDSIAVATSNPSGEFRDNWSASQVQSLLFDRDLFSATRAKEWAKSHGFKYGSIDTTDRYHHLRQFEPDGRACRTISFGESGIKAVVCARSNPVGDHVDVTSGPGRGRSGVVESETAHVAKVRFDRGGSAHLERSALRTKGRTR